MLPLAVVWSPHGEPLGGGILPIGVIDRVAKFGSPDKDTIYGNWAVMLLPFLEEAALALQWDKATPISSQGNAALRSAELGPLKCPTDPYNAEHYLRGLSAGLEGNEYARGNFAINVGPDSNCVNGTMAEDEVCVLGFTAVGGDLKTSNSQVWGSGVAGVNRSFRFAEITGGLSRTVILDEIRSGIDALDPRGVWALGQVASSLTARHGTFADAGRPNPTDPGSDEFIGCTALVQKVGFATLKGDCMPCDFVGAIGEANTQAAARSLHGEGVNVLFVDSSVQFVADDIDPAPWHAIHTRSGGEAGGQ